MKAYLILALLAFGYICQIQAATLNKPEVKGHAVKKLLEEETSQSLAKKQEAIIEALRSLESVGEDNEEGYIFPFLIPILANIFRFVATGVKIAVENSG